MTETEGAAFKRGDVVQLRSGSPPMTVQTATAEAIHVVWFWGGDLMEELFLPDMLVPA